MNRIFCAAILFSAFHSWALAQVPAAPTSPAGAAGATTTIDQDKRGPTPDSATPRTTTNSRPGNSPLPMSIKIQGDGIKLPACAAESRDGEACKK